MSSDCRKETKAEPGRNFKKLILNILQNRAHLTQKSRDSFTIVAEGIGKWLGSERRKETCLTGMHGNYINTQEKILEE